MKDILCGRNVGVRSLSATRRIAYPRGDDGGAKNKSIRGSGMGRMPAWRLARGADIAKSWFLRLQRLMGAIPGEMDRGVIAALLFAP